MYTAVFEKVFKQFTVQYEFKSLTADKELPEEVTALLPKDPAGYGRDTDIKAIAPAKTEAKVDGGTWTFKGFDKDSKKAAMENATGGMGTHLFIIVGAARERPAGDRWASRTQRRGAPRRKIKDLRGVRRQQDRPVSEARFAPPSPLGLIVPSRGAKSSHKSRAGA